MNHLSEEQLILHYYGEGTERNVVAEHLASCELFRANYQALQRTLSVVTAAPVPERSEDYGAEVWRRLQPQLGPRPALDWRRYFQVPRLSVPRWAFASALALLVLGAFLAGRFWSYPKPDGAAQIAATDPPSPLSASARERVLLNEIGSHLERSQLALIELINSKTNGSVNISVELTLARELASINRLFRRAAADAGEPGMASVLEELELVLVEVANGPAKLSAEEFAAMRQRVGAEGLLFRVKVLSAQLRTRERDAARELAASRS